MKKRMIIKAKDKIIISALSSLILINGFFALKVLYNLIKKDSSSSLNDYSTSDFEKNLLASNALSDEEKEYLNNSTFFEDLLPFATTNNTIRDMYEAHFKDLIIVPFGKNNKLYNKANGYYSTTYPNHIFIKDYEGINSINKDYIAHEFVHLCQNTSGFDLIIEASAEIISSEYFDYASQPQYTDQVKILKKLMEIIGAYPIWYYNFTGDFSLIDKIIRPYLTKNEYEDFLRCLIIDYDNNDVNIENIKKLERYLRILYRCIHNDEIENSEVINLIDSGTPLVRAYFNTRINESYYYDYDNPDIELMYLEDAMNKGIISMYAPKKEEIIDKKGPITISHFVTSKRDITSDDYINHRYGDDETIITVSKGNCTIDDDYIVHIKTPKKVYLTPTFENNDMARKKASNF